MNKKYTTKVNNFEQQFNDSKSPKTKTKIKKRIPTNHNIVQVAGSFRKTSHVHHVNPNQHVAGPHCQSLLHWVPRHDGNCEEGISINVAISKGDFKIDATSTGAGELIVHPARFFMEG